MRVNIELNRCICIHSLSQVVDITLQVLLYQRQIIPEPVQFLLSVESGLQKSVDKFRLAYNDIQEVVRQTFRHRNSLLLKDFVILIGSTPYLPKEIYRIPILICVKHLSEQFAEANGGAKDFPPESPGCGEHCSALSPKEKRKIFLTLAMNKAVQNLLSKSVLTANDKVFFFINTTEEGCDNAALTNLDGLEEDDGFELPDEELRQRRNIQQIIVQLQSSICPLKISGSDNTTISSSTPSPSRSPAVSAVRQNRSVSLNSSSISNRNNNSVWFRILQYIVHLS